MLHLYEKWTIFNFFGFYAILQVSACMERAMLDQLADYFKIRLAGYPTTLAEDEALVIICSIDSVED